MKRKSILGADIGGTAVKFILRDPRGVEILRDEVPTDSRDCAATLRRLADRLDAAGFDRFPAALGFACAGIVDTRKGTLGRAPNLSGWQGVDLKAEISGLWPDTPIALANDVNAALVGEAREGAGRGCDDIVMLALGTGVGGGILIGGSLLTGGRFGAGEIGHMVLDPAGPPCACGNRGCLEAYAGAVALTGAARERAAQDDCGAALRDAVAAGPTPRVLAGLARSGDADAGALYRLAGERLGQAVGNLVNILDPDIVVIGGGVSGAGDLLLEPARRISKSLVLCEAARSTPLVIAELGGHAAAIGAVILAADALSDQAGGGA